VFLFRSFSFCNVEKSCRNCITEKRLKAVFQQNLKTDGKSLNLQFKTYFIDLTFDIIWCLGQMIALMLVSLAALPPRDF